MPPDGAGEAGPWCGTSVARHGAPACGRKNTQVVGRSDLKVVGGDSSEEARVVGKVVGRVQANATSDCLGEGGDVGSWCVQVSESEAKATDGCGEGGLLPGFCGEWPNAHVSKASVHLSIEGCKKGAECSRRGDARGVSNAAERGTAGGAEGRSGRRAGCQFAEQRTGLPDSLCHHESFAVVSGDGGPEEGEGAGGVDLHARREGTHVNRAVKASTCHNLAFARVELEPKLAGGGSEAVQCRGDVAVVTREAHVVKERQHQLWRGRPRAGGF